MRSLDFAGVAVLLALTGCARRPSAAARGGYLYVVGCQAEIYKYDTRTQLRVGDYALSPRSGTPPAIPADIGPLEVCLAKDVTFDPKTSVFYALAPSQENSTLDPIAYTVVGFSVPSLSLVARIDAGMWIENTPNLIPQAGALPRVASPAEWQEQSEPLEEFAPLHRKVGNDMLARSGSKALLQLATGTIGHHPWSFAVADETTKISVILQDPTTTSPEYVHLVPGGAYVLMEDTVPDGQALAKTGTVHLYSSTTGRVVKTLYDDHIRTFHFTAISPDGKVLYHLSDTAWFFDLGETFGTEQVVVVTAEAFPRPPVVFFSPE